MKGDHIFGTECPPLVSCSDDLLVCEILSRLPVKSLMRLKCVCKRWQFLIEKDRHFFNLHFGRSEPRAVLLLKTPNYENRKPCLLSANLVLPSGDGLEGGGATFQRQIIPQIVLDSSVHMLNFVHGLVCFASQDTRCVLIYNPSTGESTPWIKSLVKQQQEDEKQVVGKDGKCAYRAYLNFRKSYFGYNPATKEHKVLSLWRIYNEDENGNIKVDDVLPVNPLYLGKPAVYVNGSIYWYHTKPDIDVGLSVVEFNCGTEKFRVISIPNSITDISRFCNTHLMDVDGRLALLAKRGGRYSKSEVREYWEKNNHTNMKMYLLNDNGNQHKKTKETSQSSNSDWVEEAFPMPPFEWLPDSLDSILPMAGTDFIIVRSATIEDDFSFYYYNWKKKRFSSNKVEIDGISSFLVPPDDTLLYHHSFCFHTSTENLLPVN
ncbi:hypothetical protein MKX03_024835 [Papaver bracteatum]|nr:hypothetical protein MKX03_024835 [Papaver bracteatum]